MILKRGDRGEDVTHVQAALGETPDGIYGDVTAAAVRAFQGAHGLPSDGIVGPATWAAMFPVTVPAPNVSQAHVPAMPPRVTPKSGPAPAYVTGIIGPLTHASGNVSDARGGPISDALVAIVKRSEGFRAKPYLCPAGVATIGYGNTYHADGTPVRMTDPPVTEPDAEILLRQTLATFTAGIDRTVTVPITANQRAALASFAYNVGMGAFRGSTLLRKLNAGDYDGAADQFRNWTRGGSTVLPGLVKRRAEEDALFREP